MGTYYTHGATKTDIVNEILADLKAETYYPMRRESEDGPLVADTTQPRRRLAHSRRGNSLWVLFEYTEHGVRNVTVLLYRLSSHQGSAGYKPMDEGMGPYFYDCPKSWEKELTPTTNEYALEWRRKAFGNGNGGGN